MASSDHEMNYDGKENAESRDRPASGATVSPEPQKRPRDPSSDEESVEDPDGHLGSDIGALARGKYESINNLNECKVDTGLKNSYIGIETLKMISPDIEIDEIEKGHE